MLVGSFEKVIIEDQDILNVPAHQQKFLQYLPMEAREKCKSAWARCDNGMERWAEWQETFERHTGDLVSFYSFLTNLAETI